MEITKQWIAKVAGWKANKAGKDLFAKGAVLDSANKNNIITGTLRSGAKPTRVTVKIHSEIDIDTVCPRMQCRRTGEICEHAVALMLHSISEDQVSEIEERSSGAEKVITKDLYKPLTIQLPPNFPDTLFQQSGKLGGLSVKCSVTERNATSGDAKLGEWMIKMTGKSDPGMVGLRGKQALDFLELLGAHDHVFSAENKVNISIDSSRIPMQLERDDDRIRVQLSDEVIEGCLLWYDSDRFYLWEPQQRCLAVNHIGSLWKERYWQRLMNGDAVFMPIKEFLSSIETQDEHVSWADDSELSDIPISPAEPTFELIVDGSTQQMTAKLTARYSKTDTLLIGLMTKNEIDFPIPDPSREGHFLTRNRDAEDLAAGVLLQVGFQIIDAHGAWQINDEDAVIEFLTSTLPKLDENESWEIKSSNKLRSIKNNIVRIIPEFDFKSGASSGQDWLAFDVNFKTDQGKELPKEVIQRMLSTGKRSGTSKNGKQVVISKFDADTVETALRDTNPRQENGLYYAAKNQAAYLKRLKNYYQNQEEDAIDLSIIKELPESIQATLRPYQEEGISWLYHRAKNESAALLADDMGLGKTLQTLSLIHLLGKEGGANLVVCPTSLLGNWQAEAKKFYPEFKVLILHGNKRKDYFDVAHSADIIITSYALIARDAEFYQSRSFNTLVIDEASIIRNPDTQAAKAICKIDAKQKLALTGTPVENAVRDLWSLYQFLLPGYLGTRKDFQQFYEQPMNQAVENTAVLKRLRMRVEPFMLRRTKATVAKDLPPKMHQTIYCEPSASQKKTYAKLLRQGVEKVDQLEDGAARMQILTVLLRLRQASCDLRLLDSEMKITEDEASSKLTRLIELLLEAKRGGHRVLIFSQFTTMLALIKEALTESDISFAYLDGSTKDRQKEVDRFQSPNGPDTFLISLKAGGYGLNLTAADTVVHFDPWWNPAVEAQATDRAYRIGQTKPTTVYKMVTKGTVEEKIVRLQQSKQSLISSALGDEEAPLMQGLNQTEIANLLSD